MIYDAMRLSLAAARRFRSHCPILLKPLSSLSGREVFTDSELAGDPPLHVRAASLMILIFYRAVASVIYTDSCTTAACRLAD